MTNISLSVIFRTAKSSLSIKNHDLEIKDPFQNFFRQECIPVGCVQPASMVFYTGECLSRGVCQGVSARGCLARGCWCPGDVYPGGVCLGVSSGVYPPRTQRQTSPLPGQTPPVPLHAGIHTPWEQNDRYV